MRRADRLFQIITILQSRRGAVTARMLADQLEVTERTVYRDMQALMVSGVPIESEAGVGYRLLRGYTLPPLNFSAEELEALLVGMRMVQSWSDPALGKAATHALQKILAELPPELKRLEEQTRIHSPGVFVDRQRVQFSEALRRAIRQQQVLELNYCRADGEVSTRHIEPLGLFYWGSTWTLVAWCRLRRQYREFRLDRIQTLSAQDEHFTLQRDKCLDHYIARVSSRWDGADCPPGSADTPDWSLPPAPG